MGRQQYSGEFKIEAVKRLEMAGEPVNKDSQRIRLKAYYITWLDR